jgi:hypothetical protein
MASSIGEQIMKIEIGKIESKCGDPEAFGERELVTDVPISTLPYGTKVYVEVPVSGEWGLKEFRDLMEKRLADYKDPMHIPFGMIPHSGQANDYQRLKRETYSDVLEMIPEI